MREGMSWGPQQRGMGEDDRERGGYGPRESQSFAPIVKVIEVVAQSPHGWEDAAQRALHEASKTIRNIKSIYVSDMQAIVHRDRIVEYRIVAKLSFALEGAPPRDGRGDFGD